jgi:hypothetical protein
MSSADPKKKQPKQHVPPKRPYATTKIFPRRVTAERMKLALLRSITRAAQPEAALKTHGFLRGLDRFAKIHLSTDRSGLTR